MEKSKYQLQLESLPEWVQKMVRGLKDCGGYGTGHASILEGMSADAKKKYNGFQVALSKENDREWFDGFLEMKELAQALTAPYPPPVAPERKKRAFNLVELVDDGEEGGGFDQPCCFGNRVGGHAVYCHNEAWPDSPRKCRRNRDDYKHEDCPGFVANPDYKTEAKHQETDHRR